MDNVLSNKYRLVIGDYSDDGHGKFENVDVTLSQAVNSDDLAKNYKAAVEKFGADPKDFCASYEDGAIPLEFYYALLADGFAPFEEENIMEDVVGVWVDDYVRVLMYFALYGTDLVWETVKDVPPLLIGGWNNAVGSYGVGYGLFYG